jgi:hypothetical protein
MEVHAMQPSPAEIARTLAVGHLFGSLHVAYRPGPYQVRHATDGQGRVLLLVSIVSDLGLALRPICDSDDAAVVLDVRDLPPAAGAPSLGRVWVSGWARRLDGEESRRAALAFAEVDPTGDLLDVGTRFVLYRFDAAEVRLERAGRMIDIDPKEYAEAEADPLHRIERDLLADLADHHEAEIAGFIRRQLGSHAAPAEAGGPPPRVVRLDRYGLVVAFGPHASPYRARLAFPRPMRDHADLVRFLHPVICRRAGAVAGTPATLPAVGPGAAGTVDPVDPVNPVEQAESPGQVAGDVALHGRRDRGDHRLGRG